MPVPGHGVLSSAGTDGKGASFLGFGGASGKVGCAAVGFGGHWPKLPRCGSCCVTQISFIVE